MAVQFSYSYSQPYNSFDSNGLHDYIFVPLPTLEQKIIVREIVQDEDEEDLDED